MITFSLSSDWDLYCDKDTKNIAIKSGNNALAQDVASSVRVFKGEIPMDIDRGIAYNKPETLRGSLNFEMRDQAKLISGVSDASAVFDKLENRELSCTIYVTTDAGENITIQ